MEKTIYYYYPAGWYWLLCYYAFPKNHPELVSSTVIDSAYEYAPPPPLAAPESLVNISDPSCVADKYNNLHIAYAIRSEIRYQNKVGANWSGPEVISPVGIYDQPSIGINYDEIAIVFSGNPLPGPGSQILCRRKFINSPTWGNVERLDKGTNLSTFPVCLNDQVLWSEQIDETNYEIYYSRLSGYRWTEPENLSNTLAKSILPQAAFFRGPRKSTIYYLFTDGNEMPYYLLTGKKVFTVDEIPVYAMDLGGETRSSATIQRDGFLVYGEEPYKTVDYDGTELIYSLTGLEPSGKYDIEWDWYHEFNGACKQRLRTDEILNEHKWIPAGERVRIRKPVPQAVVEDGIMEITDEITSGEGFAVLSGFAILNAVEQSGGPQGEDDLISEPFFLERIYPNPTKNVIRIRFNTPDTRKVAIKLFDVCGRLAYQENIGKSKIGRNEVLLKPERLSTGVYFLTLGTEEYMSVEKVVFLRK
ncbi:MAG: T9SS type A sorting domain-containing protein [candidate division WOR-3 bacterium]